MSRPLLLALACIGFCGTTSADQSGDAPDSEYPGWIAGLAYVVGPEPFVGDPDDASEFFPVIGYLGERLTWVGPSLSYQIVGDDVFAVSLAADVRFQGFDVENQSPELAGLVERKPAVEAGIDLVFGPLSLELRSDVSNTHGGNSAKLSAAHDWELSDRLTIGTGISAELLSEDLAGYYFGVAASEVTSNRNGYEPDSGSTVGVGITVTYELNDRTMFVLNADHDWLPSTIYNSPIVEDRGETSAFVGVIFDVFK